MPVRSGQVEIEEQGKDKNAPPADDSTDKVADLKKRIQDDSTLSTEQKAFCDDAAVARFLRARKGDVPKAELMLRNALKWRQDNNIFGIRCEEVGTQVLAGHMYTYGIDRERRTVCVLRMHTEADPHSNEEKLRFMIYSMERAIRLMGTGVEKMVWLVNCTGYNMKHNGEMSFARLLLQTLQDYYPERLGCLVICDAPFMFRALWNVLYPFIDPVTCKKIRFVSGSEEQKKKILTELFELDQVEKEMGGTSTFKFDGQIYLKQCQNDEAKRLGMIAWNSDETRVKYGMKMPDKMP